MIDTKKILAILGALALVVAGAVAVSRTNHPEPRQGKVHVVATFYPLAFFAEQIGGENAQVVNVTPAGAEPHDYEPTAQDIAQIEQSHILILNGGGLEAWGYRVQQNINPARTRIVIAGEGLTNQRVTEEGQDIVDPHIWLSPLHAEIMTDKIMRAFMQTDEAHASQYQANGEALKANLRALDEEFAQGLAHCAQQSIITSHAAFGYMATAYHLKQVPITGLSPDAEPTGQHLADIARFAMINKVHYIFFESLVSPKLAQTLAREVGAQTLVLNPLEGLTYEQLAQGKDYFSEMRANLANLRTALQCT